MISILIKMEDDLNLNDMKDDHNFNVYGRQPQFKYKWKTTSSLGRMEDNHNFMVDRRRPQVIC